MLFLSPFASSFRAAPDSNKVNLPSWLFWVLILIVMAIMSSQVFAQTPDSTPDPAASLATPTGHEVRFTLGNYRYSEPGATSISIHGAKLGVEYIGTLSLNELRHWFVQVDVRGIIGSVRYDGWCSPFLIKPNTASPNGYELDVGDPSPCSESGDED